MSRPKISGAVIRRIDMRHVSPGKNKDYRITIAREEEGAYRVYTEYGPAGRLQNGQERTQTPLWAGQAEVLADTLRDEKIRQSDSYAVTNDQRFPAPNVVPAQKSIFTRGLLTAESLSPSSRATLAAIF
jgi:hypothetical protein